MVRPPAIFGPRDTDILQFFRMAAHGVVPIPGGERWVTTAYVADVVRALLAAGAAAVWRRILHVGDPKPMTMRAHLAAIAKAGNVRARTVEVPAVLVRVAGSFGDLLQWILFAFKLEHRGKQSVEMFQDFVDFLVREYAASRRTVLIVDEAQNMGPETLEELRILSNVNADKDQVL